MSVLYCIECGKPFEPHKGRRHFCSYACCRKWHDKARNNRKIRDATITPEQLDYALEELKKEGKL